MIRWLSLVVTATAALQALAAEVARDFKGRLELASDLDQVVLEG